MTISRQSLLSVGISSVLGMSAVATAQEARTVEGLEEIIVSAQKRSESLQDVAVAVTAFTDEMRDIVGVTTISDLTDFTPGLTYSLTQDRISLRGIGRLSNNYGSDPGVATYADGFYTSSTTEAGKRPLVVDRTEILRGPQGTLYGRNSIGGAINIISKRPTEKFEGEVRATAGNYDLGILEAAISGPVTDWLRYRFVGGKFRQEEGYFRDVDDGGTEGSKSDDLYVEGQLEFNFGEAVDGWFKYSHAEWDQARRTLVTLTPYDIAPVYFGGLFPNSTFNGTATQAVSSPFTSTNPALTDRSLYDTDTPFRAELDSNHIFILELVGHLGWADIKYLGGYQGYEYTQTSDYDGVDRGPYSTVAGGVPFTIFPTVEGFYYEDKEYYSNEINLLSTGDGPLQWIVGLYQYHEQVNQYSGIRAPLQSQLATPRLAATTPFTFGPPNPDRNLQIAGALLDADAHAVFAQVDYSFTDEWKVTLGARYTEDQKDAEEFRTRALYGFAGVPYAFYSEVDRRGLLAGEWHATTGTAGIEWSPSADTLAFAKYTRGYKSGGFNAGGFSPGRTGYTDPEFIDAYELGLKQTLFNRLTANVALFYYDYQDAQIPLTVRDPVSLLNETRFLNIEKSTSMGVEVETVWAVTDALQLRLSYGFLDTEMKDTQCVIDPADTGSTAPDSRLCPALVGVVLPPGSQRAQLIDGGELPSSPKNKLAFNANYTWELPAGSLTASGSWTYRDSAYYSVFTREYNQAPSYDETDLRVLFTDAKNRFTLIAFLRNAFDDEGYERADATQSAWGTRSLQLALTAPRTYGLEAQFRFGQ
jgi:iron complex outermembrane recepter protein